MLMQRTWDRDDTHNPVKIYGHGSGPLAVGSSTGEAFEHLAEMAIGLAARHGVSGACMRDALNKALDEAGYEVRAVL